MAAVAAQMKRPCGFCCLHIKSQKFVAKLPGPEEFTKIEWGRCFKGVSMIKRKGKPQFECDALVFSRRNLPTQTFL